MENFKNTLKELERVNSALEEFKRMAVKLGMKELGMNYSNACSFCLKSLNDYLEVLDAARDLGTTPLNLLKSYKMRNKGVELIPVEMRFAPPHWVCEASVETVRVWKNSKLIDKVYKTREVTAATAQRLRAGLQPQILNLFTLLDEQDWSSEEKDRYKNEVIEAYKEESYPEFSKTLIDALWRMNVGEDSILSDPEKEQELPLSLSEDVTDEELLECLAYVKAK
jgi:hypothetical protein